ncbi:ABC transporter substrate-binding protein [Gordonia spumicola]|uniref:ABC transporter substrate-binding protein n=1 Tax=Gordonia spumicola TaxID=589161 RepID=A0A7I9V991_9ACTN|nr:ABC transporter substrate-binding protein [Gordonia spumicola]
MIGSSNTLTGPIGYANQRGDLLKALKPLGVDDIEVTAFPNGPDLNQALIAGRLDVANYGDTPALVARGSGLSTRLLNFTEFNMDAGVVAKDPSIKTLKDLAGKKIGAPKGSYIDRYLRGALKAENIDAEIVHLLPADQEGPLQTGAIAGAALPGVFPSVQLQAFEAKGFHLVDSAYRNHPTLAGTSVTVSTDAFLSKFATFGSAWQKLYGESVTAVKADWNAYVDFEIANSKASPDLIRAAANPDTLAAEPFPAAAVALITGTKKFLVDNGSVASDFDLDGWFYLQK